MSQMAVWMDHHEARIFRVDAQNFDEEIVNWAPNHVHRHPEDADTRTRNHPDDEHRFFRDVARSLASASAVLLLGPSVTKLKFIRYVHDHDRALVPKIVGVESASHPTDKQIVAHVRQYFNVPAPRIGLRI